MDSAIVDECIALIAPDAQHEAECRRQIERHVDMMRWFNLPKSKLECRDALWKLKLKLRPVGRKADRETLLRFADALADAAVQLNEPLCGPYLSRRLPTFDAAKFSKELETLVTIAREVAGSMHLEHGRPVNMSKSIAAWSAEELIETWGTKPPTLTIDGPYYRLASILYGAGTGEHGVDLSRQCKETSRQTHPARAKARLAQRQAKDE
jgi:hypothetical protein